MICCGNLALLILSALTASDTVAPAVLAAQVKAGIADRWQVPERDLVLSWGQWPADTARLKGARVSLTSLPDRDGWFAILLTPGVGAPAAVRVRAGMKTPGVVAARDLSAGSELKPEDLSVEELITWGDRPRHLTDISSLVSWEVRRSVPAGTPLLPPIISAPVAIRSGEPVQLIWDRGLIRIELEAVAANNARLGESVRARRGDETYTGRMIAIGMARIEGMKP